MQLTVETKMSTAMEVSPSENTGCPSENRAFCNDGVECGFSRGSNVVGCV